MAQIIHAEDRFIREPVDEQAERIADAIMQRRGIRLSYDDLLWLLDQESDEDSGGAA